eukprot:CAMPEP_0206211148 /NCGR_PEP_ID=MMETSP0166-20121206/17968_1 /ASSEMBLY_ACC=CAM_ASM_000260 /TAXON_ID=95228 /ORGANISM="Vannella robusta, Strain DIVA3 518/3/11/1/6" /LENGTH=33 /DNA_ID= /DNA_START= /DNA_END= /DNA_ORIENTATION=
MEELNKNLPIIVGGHRQLHYAGDEKFPNNEEKT